MLARASVGSYSGATAIADPGWRACAWASCACTTGPGTTAGWAGAGGGSTGTVGGGAAGRASPPSVVLAGGGASVVADAMSVPHVRRTCEWATSSPPMRADIGIVVCPLGRPAHENE